jgi:ABC-type bacteriocin/lantibiotic exporter with double-glycine peptidase domain
VSALVRDFGMMENGDMTEIGEKGVNLSGGQKQRVSIARAVYADADVILLDDPLSALDAHVAKEIFDECIRGYLKEKTIVFVTNRLEFVSGCDRVVMIDDGMVVADGAALCVKTWKLS